MSFLKTDGGKIGLVVAVFAIAGGVYYFTAGKSNSPLKGAVQFVCVETGELFRFARTKGILVLPIENPKTGKRTLVPCYERDGAVLVSGRQREVLKELGELNHFVDYETLQVRSEPE